MARYQAVRGNPEDKLSIILDDFSGGVNTTSSDDLTPKDESRYMSNYKLEQHGDLRTREGWKKNAVSELFQEADFPTLIPTPRSVLYGTAHEPHEYYEPNLIPKPRDFTTFSFHGNKSNVISTEEASKFKPLGVVEVVHEDIRENFEEVEDEFIKLRATADVPSDVPITVSTKIENKGSPVEVKLIRGREVKRIVVDTRKTVEIKEHLNSIEDTLFIEIGSSKELSIDISPILVRTGRVGDTLTEYKHETTSNGDRYSMNGSFKETMLAQTVDVGFENDKEFLTTISLINEGPGFTLYINEKEVYIYEDFDDEIKIISNSQSGKENISIKSETRKIDFTIRDLKIYDEKFIPFKNTLSQGHTVEEFNSDNVTYLEAIGGGEETRFSYSLNDVEHPFTVGLKVKNVSDDTLYIRTSTSSTGRVKIAPGEYKEVRQDSTEGTQPRIDFLVDDFSNDIKAYIESPRIFKGHLTEMQLKERRSREFVTRIEDLDKGQQVFLDFVTAIPENFDVSLYERVTDTDGNIVRNKLGTFPALKFGNDRYIGSIKSSKEVKTGTTMGKDRTSYTTEITLIVRHLIEDVTKPEKFKIHRLYKPPINFKDNEFTDQVLLVKVLKNDYNFLNRLMTFDSLEEYQNTLTNEAKYQFEMIMVHRVVNIPSNRVDKVKYDMRIHLFSFDITHDKVTRKVSQITKLDTELTPYLKDFGTQTLNINNIGSAVSKGSLIFTGTDHGIIETYDDKGEYKVRYVGGKKKGITNSAYKPTPLEVRRVGFNVLGTDPLTWIDNTGTTSKSIQGIYVTDMDSIPAAVLPMGKPFKIHIMYTGDKADFDVILSEGVGEDKKKLDYDLKQLSNDKGLAVIQINFKTQPYEEVEFEIKFKGDDKNPPMYDYYHIGQIPPDAKPVETIDVGSHGITQMWDRYVYFKGDTLWYSDFSRFDYVPNLNYITLPLRPNDNIVNITFFRTSYMIFTQERIYKISGMFDTADTNVELVSDTVGCVAPDSVAMVDNKLVFLSTIGLVALKAEVFRQNLENIEVIDDKVENMIETTTAPYAVALKNQYLLFLNNNFVPNYLDEERRTTDVGGREVINPNVVRYYMDNEAFAFDLYNQYQHPLFIFETGGNLFSYRWNTLYTYEDSFTDFDEPFNLELETPATNFGFPAHEKKYKQLILKLGKESYQQRFDIDVIVDGHLAHTEGLHPENIINDADIENSRFHIRKIRLPSLKGKNIAIIIRTDSAVPTTVMSISYIYKLGKIRERRAYR